MGLFFAFSVGWFFAPSDAAEGETTEWSRDNVSCRPEGGRAMARGLEGL